MLEVPLERSYMVEHIVLVAHSVKHEDRRGTDEE